MAFELVNATNQPAIIKVIGVGGGGVSASGVKKQENLRRCLSRH